MEHDSKSTNGDNDIWNMIVSQLMVISLYVIPLCQSNVCFHVYRFAMVTVHVETVPCEVRAEND
jgi:hypothetical protein